MSDDRVLDRVVPRQQKEWDIKGALNFILGGAGSGLLVAAPFAAMLRADPRPFVALGMVIRGETYHFDIVCNESARALMDLAVSESLPIGNGILTVENDEQGWRRAKRGELDKGGFAARAALKMIELKKKLGA